MGMTAGLPGDVAPLIGCILHGPKKRSATMFFKQYYLKQKPKSFTEWLWESLIELFYISLMIGSIVCIIYWLIINI